MVLTLAVVTDSDDTTIATWGYIDQRSKLDTGSDESGRQPTICRIDNVLTSCDVIACPGEVDEQGIVFMGLPIP
jgi:hypothetical protein